MERREQYYAEVNKVELRETGGGILYTPPNWDKEKDGAFNYNLRSWDSGKTWYAIEYDKELDSPIRGFRIIGDVDSLYPGLIEHIQGMRALTDYVEKNGSIDGTDPKGLEALEDAGFEVKLDTIN